MVAADRFRFLNEVRDLPAAGWDDPAVEKLWRYNLHYFDDLNARDAAARSAWHPALVERWIRENPPASGSGWEPYPTSLRIVNWIKWALGDGTLGPAASESLAVQLRWLTRRLERHLLGNHLFANAKALVFGGLFFAGAEADAWLALGLDILAREIPEQILDDGAHFELSTMYHALALEDVLDLYNVARTFPGAGVDRLVSMLEPHIAPMRAWLAAMSHPDGEIGFFNDAAMAIAPAPAELEAYAARLHLPDTLTVRGSVVQLASSGYVRLQHGAMVALLDVAPIGPDYLPAHAHADTLSFELSLFGQRVLVNSGTSRYGTGPARAWERGTAAHNTVVVDHADSSEVWGGFRVARRARPVGLTITESAPVIRCGHDGYRRLEGRVDHVREWRVGENSLRIDDRLTGTFAHAEARFHLHPSVRVAPNGARDDEGVLRLVLPDGQRVRIQVEGGVVHIEPATWHPQFGRSEPTACLVVVFGGDRVRTRIEWAVAE